MKHNFWVTPLWLFITLAGLTTGLCLLFYTVTQQNYRTSLDDPQLAIVKDWIIALGNGAMPADIVPHGMPLDISGSLSPWIAVYGSNGKLLESTGQLNGAPLALPQGVFDATQWKASENRFSWQPTPDVRQAVVLMQTQDKKYYVASGRNMHEVEQRIHREGEIVFLGWGVLMITLLIGVFGGAWVTRRH